MVDAKQDLSPAVDSEDRVYFDLQNVRGHPGAACDGANFRQTPSLIPLHQAQWGIFKETAAPVQDLKTQHNL